MKKITTAMILILAFSLSANASCEEALDYMPLKKDMIQPTSQSEVTTKYENASDEEESVVISKLTTFKGTASKVKVNCDEEEIGILY